MKTSDHDNIRRLLRRNISAWQLAGYVIANIIGLTAILTGILFYCDTGETGDDDSYFSKDYIVISKKRGRNRPHARHLQRRRHRTPRSPALGAEDGALHRLAVRRQRFRRHGWPRSFDISFLRVGARRVFRHQAPRLDLRPAGALRADNAEQGLSCAV